MRRAAGGRSSARSGTPQLSHPVMLRPPMAWPRTTHAGGIAPSERLALARDSDSVCCAGDAPLVHEEEHPAVPSKAQRSAEDAQADQFAALQRRGTVRRPHGTYGIVYAVGSCEVSVRRQLSGREYGSTGGRRATSSCSPTHTKRGKARHGCGTCICLALCRHVRNTLARCAALRAARRASTVRAQYALRAARARNAPKARHCERQW